MRVYPDRGRALRHLRYTQAVYRYGRFPRRYVLGMDQQPGGADLPKGYTDALARS